MTTTPKSDRPDNHGLDALAAAAAELREAIQVVIQESADQVVQAAKYGRTNRRLIAGLAISLALDVALTVVVFLGGLQLREVTHRLDVAQTTGRHDVLCPLYGLLLGSTSPEGRAAAPDPAAYDRAVTVIRHGYYALQCDKE